MAQFTDKQMTAFYTNSNGTAHVGGTVNIDIWEIDPVTQGVTQVVTTAAMTEVGGGFYTYQFTAYDYTQHYAVRFDATALGNRRYTPTFNSSFHQDIAFANWEELSDDHGGVSPRTTGGLLNLITAVLTNRTRIDTGAATLTIYDSDCSTPLIIYDLKDSLGNPSVVEVCERSPTTSPYTDCTVPASTPPDLTP